MYLFLIKINITQKLRHRHRAMKNTKHLTKRVTHHSMGF